MRGVCIVTCTRAWDIHSMHSVSYKRFSVRTHTRMSRVSLLSRDAGTETFEDGFIHPYAYEWGDQRPWVLEPELEPCPHAVPPCLLHLIHTHAPVRFSDAETQTPDAAHITEFKLAFCMLSHARLGATPARAELPSNLVQMILEIYAPAFAQLFVS